MNELHYGDNLEVLREKIPDEVADLIYLDPPFNSSRSYNLLFKQVKGDPSPAQIHAFEDTWTWSPLLYDLFKADHRNAPLFELVEALHHILGASEMMAYILMMAPRLLELHKKLKETGSLYLHCDPVASHYLKLILDVVFSPGGFRNEIIWKRTNARSTSGRWPRLHDTLLFYTKTSSFTFRPQLIKAELAKTPHTLITGPDGRKYQTYELTAPGATKEGQSGKPWRSFSPARMGRHWANTHETMESWDTAGLIHWPKDGGFPRRLADTPFVAEERMVTVGSIWTDVDRINQAAKERRGYPTQKPLALLERIIAASSNEGDVVMDPFCGCGTALVAAERMGRKWIGIDITYLAINEVIHRLKTECAEGRPLDYELIGSPKDAGGAEQLFRSTAGQNHKPFEQWCVTLVGGEYRDRGGADRGVDGVIPIWGFDGALHKIVIQVKGGQALTLSAVRDFASVIKDNKALLGLMISMREPTREMQLVCEQQGYADWPAEKKYPKLQIRTVKDLLEDPRQPFEIPDHARAPRQEGVGKRAGEQRGLFVD